MFDPGVQIDVEYDDPARRKRHAAGDLDSEGSTSDEDSDAESTTSSIAGRTSSVAKPQARKTMKGGKPIQEDAAAYAKRMAMEEWNRATGGASAASGTMPSPPRAARPNTLAPSTSPNAKRVAETSTSSVVFTTELKQQNQSAAGSTATRPGSASAGRLTDLDAAKLASFGGLNQQRSYRDPSALGEFYDSASVTQRDDTAKSRRSYADEEAALDAIAQPREGSAFVGKASVKTKLNPQNAADRATKNSRATKPSESMEAAEERTTAPAEAQTRPKPEVPLFDENGERIPSSRREFLELLELLGQDAEDAASGKTTRLSVEEEKEQEHLDLLKKLAEVESNRRSEDAISHRHLTNPDAARKERYAKRLEEWKKRDDNTPFMAEREEMLATLQDGFDPTQLQWEIKQSSSYFAKQQVAMERFERAVAILEDIVRSNKFVVKVNRFLHKHHKAFLETQPERQAGAFAHSEYSAFRDYAKMVTTDILQSLHKQMHDFDEDEFFDRVFDTKMATQQADGSIADTESSLAGEDDVGSAAWKARRAAVANLDSSGAELEQSALSYEVWEVLLSFMKFQSFNDLMDEYIATYYGVDAAIGVDTPPPSTPPDEETSSVASGSSAGITASGTASATRRSSVESKASTTSAASTAGSMGRARSLREMKNLPSRR